MYNNRLALYLDTNSLIKFYKNEKGSLNIHNIFYIRRSPIYLSSLTVVEFIAVILKNIRKGIIKKKQFKLIMSRLTGDLGRNGSAMRFKMISHDGDVYEIANSVLVRNGMKLAISSYDSLHLAHALKLKDTYKDTIMISSDGQLLNVCRIEGLHTYNPESCNGCFISVCK